MERRKLKEQCPCLISACACGKEHFGVRALQPIKRPGGAGRRRGRGGRLARMNFDFQPPAEVPKGGGEVNLATSGFLKLDLGNEHTQFTRLSLWFTHSGTSPTHMTSKEDSFKFSFKDFTGAPNFWSLIIQSSL